LSYAPTVGLVGGTNKNYIIRARFALRVRRLGVGSLEVSRGLLWCTSHRRLPFAYALTLTTTVDWMVGCSEAISSRPLSAALRRRG